MSRARILIVEDEILVAAELQASLEDRGFSAVGIAPDLNAALALANEKPDIALVDMNLRDGRTGPQIAERLARDYGVVVLFLTANARMAQDSATPGVIGVLDKPFEEDTIAAAVEYALATRTGAREHAPPPGLTLMAANA